MKNRRREHYRKPGRRRRRLIIAAVLLMLALAVGVGEYLASRTIADKLRATVDQKMDAHLELGPLVYVPPYGALAWDARITRGGKDLFAVSRVKLALAEFPSKNKPIIISRLFVDEPVLNVAPRSFDKIAKPSGDPKHPHKLSDVLRLKEVRVNDGQVTYTDPKRPSAPPTVWGNLALDIDTVQKSVSKYTFNLVSRAGPLAEVTASGMIDVDDLILDINNSTMKLRAEPEPTRSPLPAACQEFIRQQRINGSITITGSGQVPLREPQQANFSAAIGLLDATAVFGPRKTPLDYARASLVAKMSPGQPINVQINRLDFSSTGRQVVVNKGKIELNPAARTWSVAEVDGQLNFAPPTTNIGVIAAIEPPRQPRPAPAASSPSPAPVQPPSTEPVLASASGQPATQPVDDRPGLEKLAIAGKADFTAAISGPFELGGKAPWEAIQHEIIIYPREASLLPKNFVHRVEGVGGGEIRIQHGMIVFQELQGHYGEDLLRLRSARLPIEGLPKLARWQEISGTVVFHRPIRSYSEKLDKIFDPLNPDGSFLIAGAWTVDKRPESLTPEGKPKHTFDLIVSTDVGSFSLTKHNILLEKMRGDATVSNSGVDVHELSASILDGTLQGTGRWNRESKEHSTYEGEAMIRNADLAELEDRLREEPAAKPLEGRIFAHAQFNGALTKGAPAEENLRTINGAGEMEIIKGSLFKVPVISHVTSQVKGLKNAATIGDAAAEFEIEKGRLKIRDAAVSSPVVGLQGGGTMTLDGKDLDLRVVAAPLADWRENLKATKIPIVSNVAGALAGGLQKMLNAATGALLYEFRVQGSTDRVELVAVPAPVLTDSAAFVFEKMLVPPKKDQRPIDLLKRDREQSPRAETR